jgi:very-short-patch-repair endonuclease
MEFPGLAAVAAEQGGLFTWRQAREAGYSPWQIRVRLSDGRWQQLAPRVLGGAGVGDNPWVRDRAAYLAAGQPATLSGPSAARLHSIDVPALFSCVTVPLRRHVEIPGVRLLREPVGEDDVILLADMLVTTRTRTVFDCLRLLPRDDASSLLDRALQKKWITVDGLVSRIERHGRRKGAPHLRALVAEASLGAHSAGERLLHQGLRHAGIVGWTANREVYDAAGLIGVVDIAFAGIRLAIEVDGRAWHSASDRFQRDRTRQNRLVNAGWTVLRFTWHDLDTDMPGVISTIRTALSPA